MTWLMAVDFVDCCGRGDYAIIAMVQQMLCDFAGNNSEDALEGRSTRYKQRVQNNPPRVQPLARTPSLLSTAMRLSSERGAVRKDRFERFQPQLFVYSCELPSVSREPSSSLLESLRALFGQASRWRHIPPFRSEFDQSLRRVIDW